MRLYEIMQRPQREDRTSQTRSDYHDEGSSRPTSDNRPRNAGSTCSQQGHVLSPAPDSTDTYFR